MIDDKKIEAAKEEIYEDRFLLNGEEIVFNNDEKEEMFYKEDIKEAIRHETCVKNRNSLGGTSYHQVDMQLALAKDLLSVQQKLTEQARQKQIYID